MARGVHAGGDIGVAGSRPCNAGPFGSINVLQHTEASDVDDWWVAVYTALHVEAWDKEEQQKDAKYDAL